MGLRYYRNGPARSLSFPLANGTDTSITVDSAAGFPVQFPYTIIIEPNSALEEVCDVTAAVGNVLTITRGVDSTTASAHGAGVAVWHGVSARDPREANDHVNATLNVHGRTGALMDTDSAQSIPGVKTFDTLRTTGGGDVVTLGASQAVTGTKTFTDARTVAGGAVMDVGSTQTVTGAKTYSGPLTYNGATTFNAAATFASTLTVGANALTGAFTAYTPVRRNGSGGATLGSGTGGSLTGQYKIIGDKICVVEFSLILGTGFAVGTGLDWVVTLPFSPKSTRVGGNAFLFSAADGNTRNKSWRVIGTNEIVFQGEAGNRFSSSSPVTWGVGDEIFGRGWYELP